MIFNSIEFVIFFAIFFILYYFPLKEKTNLQNIFLLVASYVFYAWASWKILPVLVLSTFLFYFVGIAIFKAKTEKKKSLLKTLGIVFGVGMLLYFKYTNFFITSFKDLFESIGLQTNLHTFKIIMPLGISFYTFRLLSYIIDINRGKYEPTRNIVTFSTYVAFFPGILSGPIDRPDTFIPQIQKKRVFNSDLAVEGCRQILWGAFKKIVLADNLATFVNQVHDDFHIQNSSTLILAAILYTFQIYTDFSGYTDMAIGIGKLLGFKMTKNFNYPLFAQNIADFWRRWHISLTSWLTDYIFMPLNIKFRNWGIWGMIGAIIVDFVICGLWHGDNWTFLLWGFYHGLLFIPLILSGAMFKKTKMKTNRFGFPKFKNLVNMLFTFFLVTFGLIIFRSETINNSFEYISCIFTNGLFSSVEMYSVLLLMICVAFLFFEWMFRDDEFPLQKGLFRNPYLRWSVYLFLVLTISFFGGKPQTFIYFQF